MLTIEEMEEELDRLVSQLPEAIFDSLNGGINFLEEEKLSSHAVENDYFVLGDYHCERGLGKYINLYCGSFARLYGNLPNHEIAQKLKEVLHHELTHHLEWMAGDRSLEILDEKEIENYQSCHKKDTET